MEFTTGDVVGDCIILAYAGEGGQSTVYSAHSLELDKYVAIKVFPGYGEKSARHEYKIMSRLAGEGILPVHSLLELGVDEDGTVYGIVTDYYGAELGAVIDDEYPQGLEMEAMWRVLRSTSRACQRVLDVGYYHCDIKSDNILLRRKGSQFDSYYREEAVERYRNGESISSFAHLVTADYEWNALSGEIDWDSAVLCDFANSQRHQAWPQYPVCIAPYRPPEAHRRKDYRDRSEVWCLGCLVAEMVTGNLFWSMEESMLEGEWKDAWEGEGLATKLSTAGLEDGEKREIDSVLFVLLHQMLREEMAMRPSMATVVEYSAAVLKKNELR